MYYFVGIVGASLTLVGLMLYIIGVKRKWLTIVLVGLGVEIVALVLTFVEVPGF